MTNPNQSQSGNLMLTHASAERQKLTSMQKGAMLMAWLSVITVLGTGCSAKSVDNQPQKANTKVESEKKVELSSSEKAYAEYLKTLSPEQVALRESLSPDALAKMSEAEMTEAFTIKADEVMVDDKLDIDLYAEAFTARYQAMANSGISDIEYAKWGGLDSFGTDDMEKAAESYFNTQSMALFGYLGSKDVTYVSLTNGSVVDQIIENGSSPQPKERYHLRITLKPDSSKLTEQANESYDARFTVRLTDNWEEEVMFTKTGFMTKQTDSNLTWNINGLHITETGSVLPNSEITTN